MLQNVAMYSSSLYKQPFISKPKLTFIPKCVRRSEDSKDSMLLLYPFALEMELVAISLVTPIDENNAE